MTFYKIIHFFSILFFLYLQLSLSWFLLAFNELKLRAKIISFSIVAIAIIFSLTSKIFIPFFREHSNLRTALLPYYPIYSAIKLAKSITQKLLPFTYVADDAVLADDKKKF